MATTEGMRCPTCDNYRHEGSCLAAMGGLVVLLHWEIRELKAAVQQLRAENARAAEWRTVVRESSDAAPVLAREPTTSTPPPPERTGRGTSPG
jgi:hypothetical protein